MKVKLNELKKTAKELNELLGLEPAIDVKCDEAKLAQLVGEAFKMLEEGEEDDLSATGKAVYKAWLEDKKPVKPAKVEEEDTEDADEAEEEEEEEDTDEEGAEIPAKLNKLPLEDMVLEAEDIEVLKTLVKQEETFASVRKGIQFAKDLDKLRAKMLLLVNAEKYGKDVPEAEAEKPAKAKAEKAEKPAKVKAEKTAKVKTDNRPSFEEIGKKLFSKVGESLPDFIKEYTTLYTAKGKTDAAFIEKRAKIYMDIAKKSK